MESSTVVAFRALVMLACLIVVPLAAIFGSQFPDVVKSVLIDRFWPANIKLPGEPVQRPESPALSAGPAPAWRSEAPLASGGGNGFANPAPRPLAGDPAGARQAPGVIADGLVRPAAADVAVNPGTGLPTNDPGVTGYPAAAAPAATAPPGAGPSATGPPAAGPQAIAPDRFTWMERKLREQGATYYLLETWVNEGERYRFFCKIAISNNPGHTQNFEATDSDPLRAMGRVVDQVEAWRTGRPQ